MGLRPCPEREAIERAKMLKLNLGSGTNNIDGYINIDKRYGQDAYPLDFDDESADEIRASHILEHFGHNQVVDVVKHWACKLKVGGVLKIAVPDFKKIAQSYIDGDQQDTCSYLMGGQVDENDYHKSVFDEQSLRQIMEAAGIKDIQYWDDYKDTCQLPISLNLMGVKADVHSVKRTVRCVISMPRVGFTANSRCMLRELSMRGIECTLGTGAYWHQVLTNIMEQEIKKRPDYLLTLDYDTWFTYKHVVKMMELMESSGADAVVSGQMKRETDELLLNADKTTMSKEEYESGMMPINSGHFGCTVFRTSSFEKLKKPWFLPKPGPDGGWNEGRIDADIYFWKNFKDSGLKALLATKLMIGHLQLMCTFPGTFENSFKPVHCYLDDVENGKLPKHISEGLK